MNARSGSSSDSPVVDGALEIRDARVADARLLEMLAHLVGVRRGEERAKAEEIALHPDQNLVDARHGLDGARHAERCVQLVHGAVGLEHADGLRNAATAEESRVAGVARLGVDLHGDEYIPEWRSGPLEHAGPPGERAGRPRA